jgi:hypothetical protein
MPEHASRFAGLYDQQNENRIADWGGDELFTRMPTPRAVDDAPAPRFRPQLALVDAPEDRRRTPPGDEWSGRDRRRAQTAADAMVERAERLGLSVVDDRTAARWDAAEWAAATLDERVAGRDERTATRDERAEWAATRDERAERLDPLVTSPRERAGRGPGETADAIVRQWDADGASREWDAMMAPPDDRAPNGRRTKVITGRPDRAPRPLSVAPAERRRPPRTPAEWIGPRPDRIVAWAFILGLLLILVAISTADAATF